MQPQASCVVTVLHSARRVNSVIQRNHTVHSATSGMRISSLTEMINRGKRHVRNGDNVRCPRARFVLVKYVQQSLADHLNEKSLPRTTQSSIMYISYTSERLSPCTFSSTARRTDHSLTSGTFGRRCKPTQSSPPIPTQPNPTQSSNPI